MPARRSRRSFSCAIASATSGLFLASSVCAAPEWASTLTAEPRGNFPDLRPVHATYAFGWSGITAATADVYFHRGEDNAFFLEGRGRTIGLARMLWKYDITYRSAANAETLRAVETHQVETVRGKRIETLLEFSEAGVSRTRIEGNPPKPSTKEFPLENLHDLHSVLLYIRSQPLRDRSNYRVAVYPANSAYVATLTVSGRERVRVRAGSYNAIKLDLQLQRIGKKNELEPHRKFRRASIWVSDDNDRILLRVEGQIFIGSVTAELQSVRFDNS
ncbi:MAG: DUF3108 domain-containing protein [Chthoniobacterales bacterium]